MMNPTTNSTAPSTECIAELGRYIATRALSLVAASPEIRQAGIADASLVDTITSTMREAFKPIWRNMIEEAAQAPEMSEQRISIAIADLAQAGRRSIAIN